MTTVRSRKVSRVTGALLLTLATSLFFVARAQRSRAASATPLGSFSLTATAPGVEVSEDRPDATTHPEGEGSVQHTSTLLATGGTGNGLSTVFWPGPLISNAGSPGRTKAETLSLVRILSVVGSTSGLAARDERARRESQGARPVDGYLDVREE